MIQKSDLVNAVCTMPSLCFLRLTIRQGWQYKQPVEQSDFTHQRRLLVQSLLDKTQRLSLISVAQDDLFEPAQRTSQTYRRTVVPGGSRRPSTFAVDDEANRAFAHLSMDEIRQRRDGMSSLYLSDLASDRHGTQPWAGQSSMLPWSLLSSPPRVRVFGWARHRAMR
jgi:hypothetical protein